MQEDEAWKLGGKLSAPDKRGAEVREHIGWGKKNKNNTRDLLIKTIKTRCSLMTTWSSGGFIYSFIHFFFSNCLSFACWHWVRVEYTLITGLTCRDKQLFTLTFTDSWELPWTCMTLNCGRKPEHLQVTKADMGKTCKLHTERSDPSQVSNPEPSCCELTVLTTQPACCTEKNLFVKISVYVWTRHKTNFFFNSTPNF